MDFLHHLLVLIIFYSCWDSNPWPVPTWTTWHSAFPSLHLAGYKSHHTLHIFCRSASQYTFSLKFIPHFLHAKNGPFLFSNVNGCLCGFCDGGSGDELIIINLKIWWVLSAKLGSGSFSLRRRGSQDETRHQFWYFNSFNLSHHHFHINFWI